MEVKTLLPGTGYSEKSSTRVPEKQGHFSRTSRVQISVQDHNDVQLSFEYYMTYHSIGSISDATFTDYTASKAVLFELFLSMATEYHEAKSSTLLPKRTIFQVRNAKFFVGVDLS